jgi:hypothetical protein
MNDLSPEARALLELASGEDSPNSEDRVRVRRALAASLTAGVVSSSATAAAASKASLTGALAASGTVAKSTVGIWLTVGFVAGLAGSAAIFVSTPKAPSTASAPQPDAVRAKAAAPKQPSAPVAAPEAPEATTAPATVHVETPPVAAKPPISRPAPNTAKGSVLATARASSESSMDAPPAVPSLGPETALLESARTALGRGDGSTALALLERHEREFPTGVLLEERLAAKVLALCSVGRRDEAARTASRLLRLSPTSPLRARILDSCAYEH